MMGRERRRVNVLGVEVDPIRLDEVLERAESFIRSGEKKTIHYVNVHCVNLARKDPEYREILNRADLVYCDGYGVVLGARIAGERLPGRMTGADWIYVLGEFCARRGFSIYLLGSRPGVSETAARRLRSIYPSLRISGVHHGYLTDDQEAEGAIREVNACRPDILLVGMGSPIQERFISRHRHSIDAPVCWSVGALFDFVAGMVPRAPKWMLDNGLEWLFRLLCEPRRLWNRYLVGNAVFLLGVMGVGLKKHLGRRSPGDRR